MRNIIFTMIFSVCCVLFQLHLKAQVKTKTYFEGVPKLEIGNTIEKGLQTTIFAPAIFNELLTKDNSSSENLGEYKSKFALPVEVAIDFMKVAKSWEEGDFLIYSLSLKAEKALNISAQFSEFRLSKNSLLSVFTSHEITDSITQKENNEKNVWATRVYQGNRLHIVIKIPKNEHNQTKLKINQISFGYKKFGSDFFGQPGSSSTCNINVLCPEGNGWANERNSVALIVSGGTEACTGALIMNACGTNIPYLLTAHHCLDANVQNWVFQFQTWSNTCNPNGTFREDVQFNGCQVRANNAATDFALVQLNQTPPPNLGITYSGWNRNAVNPLNSTGIHHPKGDLMKISRDFQPAFSVSYFGGPSNHWRASFDQGIVQYGSSGSPLYDQNHRIVGQLHGNQNNQCFDAL